MPIELFTEAETHYTITFNKALSNKGQKKKRRDSDAEDPGEGPIVDRRCCKCGHERMSYAALQLR
jgi:DNA-directed RNA polymerase I subunit RPA12